MRTLVATLVVAAVALTIATPRDARACGGFFCDGPPPGQPPMPVDQTGETIVFVFDGENVEAHIQIQYVGDPQRFAWLIPLQQVPEITVGSAQFFVNLLNGTVPTVTLSASRDACRGPGSGSSSGPGCGFGASADSAEASPASGNASGGPKAGKPLVERRDSVGAFEVNIVRGSGTDVQSWLVDNGYLPDDEAPAIVDQYAAQGYVFAAIKLKADAGLDELHPLIVKYRGSEPCIPLKLTRIAAREDMAVRAFFLGERRTVPVSYRHVTLNFARFDWTALGGNYVDLVSRAVDSPGAAGRAFVTEYAGSSSVVSANGLSDSRQNPNPFATIGALNVVDELERQGLMACPNAGSCNALHPQVLPLLRNHLPPPAGVSEAAFWACTSCYATSFDASAFDGAAFARDMDERVVQPGRHAQSLLRRWPYITRLFTTISPSEMTEDPTFVELPPGKSYGDVPSALNATDRTTCDAKQVMNLADGREIVHQASAWPVFDEGMPWAERVEEFTSDGSRVELRNLRDSIDRELKAWNAEQGYDPGSADREVLSDASGGGACLCQMRSVPGHGVAVLLFAALGLLRRLGTSRTRQCDRGRCKL